MSEGRITNAQLYEEIKSMRKQMDNLLSAEGYAGRLLVLSQRVDTYSKLTLDTHVAVFGNGDGKPGIKGELADVRHTVRTILSLTRWVLTPILGAIVGMLFQIYLGG